MDTSNIIQHNNPTEQRSEDALVKDKVIKVPKVVIFGPPHDCKTNLIMQCEDQDGIPLYQKSFFNNEMQPPFPDSWQSRKGKDSSVPNWTLWLIRPMLLQFHYLAVEFFLYKDPSLIESEHLRGVFESLRHLDVKFNWVEEIVLFRDDGYLRNGNNNKNNENKNNGDDINNKNNGDDINNNNNGDDINHPIYFEFWKEPHDRIINDSWDFTPAKYKATTPSYKVLYQDLIALSQEPAIVEMLPFEIGLYHGYLNENFSYYWPRMAQQIFGPFINENNDNNKKKNNKNNNNINNLNNSDTSNNHTHKTYCNNTNGHSCCQLGFCSCNLTEKSSHAKNEIPFAHSIPPEITLYHHDYHPNRVTTGYYGQVFEDPLIECLESSSINQNHPESTRSTKSTKSTKSTNSTNSTKSTNQNHLNSTKTEKKPLLMEITQLPNIVTVRDRVNAFDELEKADVVVYMVPLIEYNHVNANTAKLHPSNPYALYKDTRHIYDESIKFFHHLVNEGIFDQKLPCYGYGEDKDALKDLHKYKKIYLIFDKIDLFAQKLQYYPFRDSHPDYLGDEHDSNDIIKWLVDKYLDVFEIRGNKGQNSTTSSDTNWVNLINNGMNLTHGENDNNLSDLNSSPHDPIKLKFFHLDISLNHEAAMHLFEEIYQDTQ